MKVYLVFVLFLFNIIAKGHALNIRDALTAAYRNNAELLAAQQGVVAYHENIVQAKKGFRPLLQVKGTNDFSRTNQKPNRNSPEIGSKGYDRNGQLILRQNIFSGFSDVATVSKTEFDIQSQWAQLKITEQNILLQVIKAYLDLYVAYATVEVYKGNLTSMQKSYESVREKRIAGEETLTNEAAAEAQYANAQSQHQQSLSDLETAKATFFQLTGLSAPEKMLPPNDKVSIPTSINMFQDIALREHPSYLQAIADLSSAKQNKRAVTGQLLPSLDLIASSTAALKTNKYNQPIPNVATNSTATTITNDVALTLTIPLYDQGATRSQRRQAKDVVVQKRTQIEKVRRDIIQACKQAYLNYVAAKANLKSYEIAVKSQSITVGSIQQEMLVGTKVLTDVLYQQSQLLQTQLTQIKNIQQYYYAMYQILSLQGKLTAEALQLPVNYFKPQENFNRVKNYL